MPLKAVAALRAVRSAPHMSLEAAAAATGAAVSEMMDGSRLAARGGCAAVAAACATHRDDPGLQAVGVAHPACPPPLRLMPKFVMRPLPGTAGWGVRHRDSERQRRTRRSFAVLATDPDDPTRAETAADPECPPAMLAGFMNTPSAFTDDALSENLRCPAGALTALAGAAQPMLRVSAAIRRFCPQVVIRTLAGDDFSMVRMSAARNPRCPSDVLAELAQDPDPQVRESVAANLVCSPDLLTELAGDATVLVRCAVADHPTCSPDLLAMLANDARDLVRCHTAKNPLCPPLALVRLADDPEEMIAEAVAGNPRCPAEILERFCDDAYVASRTDNICAAAAANPSIPLAAFDHISADDCAVASGDAVSDPACPQRLLEVLARFAPECSASEAAASNQNCPPEALKLFASSESLSVRCRAASNPATPSAVLEMLSNDTNTAVAVTAALNPSTPWAGLRDCARRLAAEQRAEQRS